MRYDYLITNNSDKMGPRYWWEGGDNSRETIILNISVIGGDYSTEAIKRGTVIVRGKTLFYNGGGKRWGEDN